MAAILRNTMKYGYWVFLGSLLFLTHCSRKTDFLHYIKDEAVQEYSGVHPLKQLTGQRSVDILWVIDNSGSMEPHQNALISNADTFISKFSSQSGLEWKMGVLSTGVDEPPLVGFAPSTPLNYQMSNAIPVFQKTIRRLGTSGDSIERTYAPVIRHLTENPNFTRPDATLAVIFLSDAPDQSEISTRKLVDFVASLKGGRTDKFVAYGVLSPREFKCPDIQESEWALAGSQYELLFKATGGKLYSLCADFGDSLSKLSDDLVTRIERPFIALEFRPKTETIRVIYQGKQLPGGSASDGGFWVYDYDRNRVVFHSLSFAPGEQEEVSLSYEY
jgi:hypothetical protein